MSCRCHCEQQLNNTRNIHRNLFLLLPIHELLLWMLIFFIAHVASSVTFKIHTHPHTFINLLIFASLYVCLPSKSFNLSIKKASAIHKDIKKSIRIHSHRERVFFSLLSTMLANETWTITD